MGILVTKDGLLFVGLDGELYLATFHPIDRIGNYWWIDEVRLEWA